MPRRSALALAALAVCAAVVGLLVTGGNDQPRIADPGLVVRWGLPISGGIAWVAGAGALGLLILAAFITPERTSTNRRATATRLAAAFGIVWGVAQTTRVVLVFADIAGLPLTDGGLYPQLGTFLFTLEATRVLAICAGLALFVGVVATRALSRGVLAWLAFIALVALFLPALSGHAGGSTSHEDAVNSSAAHLGGVGIWAGGLLALVIMRSALGADLGISVRRFSVLFTWAFAIVGLSGVQQAIIKVGTWDGFTTGYGVLVVAKIIGFTALGFLGWQQRRLLAGRLTAKDPSGATFARFAVTELAIMAVAAGFGVALSRSEPPSPQVDPERSMVLVLTGFPDPGPLLGQWFTAWRINWLFLAVALIAMGLYAAAVIRLRRRGDAWPWWRTALWMLGWLLWIWLTCGAPDIWGRVLFSMHMVMHMGVAMTVPLFLVPAAPLTLLLRAVPARTDKTWGLREVLLRITHSRVSRVLAIPVVAASLFFASMAAFYYTPLFELALTTHTGHILMMGHFLLTGYLFAWVLIGVDPGPPRWPPLALLVVLFATISFHAFFGVALTGSQDLLAADFFQQLALPWGPDPLADQHTAGEIAWGVGEAPTLVLAIVVALQWYRREERLADRMDRQADRDGDADLVAYNAWLSELRQETETKERS
ncbi:MAG: bifunctional copper resistance protein CopD/cytochrome c oxidase assembly protein [Phycicoccus sp.]|nr:bifunctional copper resistance protein CopD/cytochrome c oxidase assembly protein [Phycicoccus sp.]